jgi:UDP-glucose 4-epimerase
LDFIDRKGISNFVFSSSCTVYGNPNLIPVSEKEPTKFSNSPYGNTKRWAEEIIQEFASCKPHLRAVLLRYFNPVGADDSGIIGELPIGIPSNLMPYITQTAIGIRKYLNIYGTNYETKDGTAIRDYIHVSDLARAHVCVIEHTKKMANTCEVFNVGTGQGISVLEMVEVFQEVNKLKLNFRFTDRREGDLGQIWADTSKAQEVLHWKSEYDLETMVQSAWRWQRYVTKNKLV